MTNPIEQVLQKLSAVLCDPDGDCCIEGSPGDRAVIDEALAELGRLSSMQADAWQEAVIDELVIANIYRKEHDVDPRKAIKDAINWHVEVALDPAVSEAARKLQEGRAEQARDAADAARYRWLRDPETRVGLVLDKVAAEVPYDEGTRTGGYCIYEYRCGDELDAAIDAAMKTGGSEP